MREASGAKQAMMARLPGLRQQLPERKDVFGVPLAKPSGLKTWDFTAPRKGLEDRDPFMKEMLRLGVGIPTVQKQQKPFSQSQVPDESDKDWRERQAFIGQGTERVLRNEVSKNSFQEMGDNARRYHLQAVMAQERKRLNDTWERDQVQKTGINRPLLLRRERLQQQRQRQ